MSKCAKQVRFAPQNIIYPPETCISAITVSISPSSSSSSSRSSVSSHPSKTDRHPGPTPYVSLCAPQQQFRGPVKYADRHGCHPLLETSAITYDLRDPVSTIPHNNNWLSTETLHQSAVIPSLARITITSSHLPWTINVYASNTSYITLQDIFSSIHSVLRTNITSTEFQLLPSHHHRKRASRAYQQRYRRLRRQSPSEVGSNGDTMTNEASESEKHAGMKRVDFLMGHTKFLGISSKGCQPNDQWSLHVASSTMEL